MYVFFCEWFPIYGMSYLMIFISYLVYIYCYLFQNVDYYLKSSRAKLPQYTISSPHINHYSLNQSTTFIISHYKLTACLRLLLIATFSCDDVPFGSTLMYNPQKKRLITWGYNPYNYMVVTNSYSRDNELHHSMVIPWPAIITAKIFSCE